MKNIFLNIMVLLISLPGWASFNEVECDGKSADINFSIEIEMPFPQGSSSRRGDLIIYNSENETSHGLTLISRFLPSFYKLTYSSSHLLLEIDIWPDRFPRWGRNYPARVHSSLLPSRNAEWVDCEFPNIH